MAQVTGYGLVGVVGHDRKTNGGKILPKDWEKRKEAKNLWPYKM